MQEELENVFLADQAKQKQLEELKQQESAKGAELEKDKKEKAAGAERVKALEAELVGVKGERDARVKEKEAAREEADLALLQLHQVQEELEYYLSLSGKQSEMISAADALNKRAAAIISKLS